MGALAAAAIPDESSVGLRRSWTSRHSWAAAAVALTLAGMLGSAVAASAVSRGDASQSIKAFERSSTDVASTLQLAIQHEDDLVINAGAFVTSNPTGSQAGFARWATSARVLARYPELYSMAVLVIVPAARLPGFAAALARTLGGRPTLRIVPPGARPFYCLPDRDLAGVDVRQKPVFDPCASDGGLLHARDLALRVYNPRPRGSQ